MKAAQVTKFADPQLKILSDRNARASGTLFASCPLCGVQDGSGAMEDYIVRYMRLLARRSLASFGNDVNDLEGSDFQCQTSPKPESGSTLKKNFWP